MVNPRYPRPINGNKISSSAESSAKNYLIVSESTSKLMYLVFLANLHRALIFSTGYWMLRDGQWGVLTYEQLDSGNQKRHSVQLLQSRSLKKVSNKNIHCTIMQTSLISNTDLIYYLNSIYLSLCICFFQ